MTKELTGTLDSMILKYLPKHTTDNTITLTRCCGQTEYSMHSPITSHSKESLNICQSAKDLLLDSTGEILII